MVETNIETRYEVFCNIDLNKLVCMGILSSHLLDWKVIYETYNKEILSNSIEVSKQFVADEYNCSVRTVERIVKFMSE